MSTENVLNVKRQEVNVLNGIISECGMGDGSKESNKSITKFKKEISKKIQDMEEFQKTAIEDVKTERFRELIEKQKDKLETNEQKEFDELNELLNKKLNDVMLLYMNEDTTIKVEQISEDDFFEFVFANKKKLNFNQIDFFFRIINKGGQFFQFFKGNGVSQLLVDLAFDGTGSVLHDVIEGFVLAVNIGEKMLGALG